MTRRGKIARLPRVLRDELNQRIEDGETGARIVEWLNGREDVQGVLTIHFGSRPINEQNLSDWRKGGYADWQEQQATFELANGIMDEAAERKDLVTDGRLSDHVGDMAALILAKMIRTLRRMEDGPEQWETALKVVREVVRLRKSDREQEEEKRRRETHENYARQSWQRTRASFERTEEEVDQLIMRQLVAAGRGRLEDIPAPTRSTRAKVRRAEDGGSTSMSGSRSTSRSRSRSTSVEGGRAGGETLSPPEADKSAQAGKPAQAGKDGVCLSTESTSSPQAGSRLGGKTDALQEGAPQAGSTGAPQEPVVSAVLQGSTGFIKVNPRSRKEERWIDPRGADEETASRGMAGGER